MADNEKPKFDPGKLLKSLQPFSVDPAKDDLTAVVAHGDKIASDLFQELFKRREALL